MGSSGRFLVALVVAVAMPLGSFAQACTIADRAVLLILDASYSMLNRVAAPGGPTTRFAAARNAVSGVVDIFPDDGFLALRFYGSQSQATRMDCTDTMLAVPFGPALVNRAPIKAALAQAHARGVTPIAYSLAQAARDFPSNSLERTIILVSDGGESCDGDPCATAALLHTQGFVINAVGFMIAGIARAQLRCIAAAAGGKYFDVPVAVSLSESLGQAFGQCPVATLPVRRNDDDLMTG
jgi:Ca-activated chloride channel family protein